MHSPTIKFAQECVLTTVSFRRLHFGSTLVSSRKIEKLQISSPGGHEQWWEDLPVEGEDRSWPPALTPAAFDAATGAFSNNASNSAERLGTDGPSQRTFVQPV